MSRTSTPYIETTAFTTRDAGVKALIAVRTQLLLTDAWYGYIMAKLELIADWRQETLTATYRQIRYNVEYVTGSKLDEVRFAIRSDIDSLVEALESEPRDDAERRDRRQFVNAIREANRALKRPEQHRLEHVPCVSA